MWAMFIRRGGVLTVGSLCTGIGGLDLGLERAGLEVRWQAEVNEYASGVLRDHWPNVPNLGDIRAIETAPAVDVIAGGFPCPPVSRAGKRKRQLDERWLWPAFARVVRLVRPRYVVIENVPGLLDGGIADVLGDLAAGGFDAEWSLVSACSVGAPHLRDRVFIVAYPARGDESDQSAHRRWPAVTHEPRGSRGRTWASPAWLPEPEVGRVADGLPSWMVRDPLSALGNAVVPQVAETIGHLITAHNREAA